ncbi:MAG: helix-turn-helix transcriptional regulator [bacterium]|nr:helix-turn-helix transcriptional regulator [bacterium]MCM1375129.1 helix-turn-helix transcriptional regulator [Muribaculum sp.]
MKAQEAVVLRINGLCKKHQISVNHLAMLAGMNPSTLKNIVYGLTRNTGIETVQKICSGLNMSLADFFEDDLFRRLDLELD